LEKGVCQPANIPRPGYFPAAPHFCPICGARACYDPGLSSRNRGVGWSCEKGGTSHYWRHELAVLQAAYAEKWKRLGVDPATFKERLVFPFPDGYDPERVPTSLLPDDTLANP
jgi:hypothetical protein